MGKQITVAELSAEVLGEMTRLNYAESTLVLFRRAFRQLGEYAGEHSGGLFAEEVAVDFLNDKFERDKGVRPLCHVRGFSRGRGFAAPPCCASSCNPHLRHPQCGILD